MVDADEATEIDHVAQVGPEFAARSGLLDLGAGAPRNLSKDSYEKHSHFVGGRNAGYWCDRV